MPSCWGAGSSPGSTRAAGDGTSTLPDVDRFATLDVSLVRHAMPVPGAAPEWAERYDERPLSEQGQRQADELACAWLGLAYHRGRGVEASGPMAATPITEASRPSSTTTAT